MQAVGDALMVGAATDAQGVSQALSFNVGQDQRRQRVARGAPREEDAQAGASVILFWRRFGHQHDGCAEPGNNLMVVIVAACKQAV